MTLLYAVKVHLFVGTNYLGFYKMHWFLNSWFQTLQATNQWENCISLDFYFQTVIFEILKWDLSVCDFCCLYVRPLIIQKVKIVIVSNHNLGFYFTLIFKSNCFFLLIPKLMFFFYPKPEIFFTRNKNLIFFRFKISNCSSNFSIFLVENLQEQIFFLSNLASDFFLNHLSK
jgi:hypothetical protein